MIEYFMERKITVLTNVLIIFIYSKKILQDVLLPLIPHTLPYYVMNR